MTDMERDYLNAMEQGFLGRATYAREQLRMLRYVGSTVKADQFADCMEICAELIKQIREDFEKFEALEGQKNLVNETLSKLPKWDEGGNV